MPVGSIDEARCDTQARFLSQIVGKSRKHSLDTGDLDRRDWWKILLLGLLLTITASLTLITGKLHYLNVWHAPLFAPYGVLIGVLAMVVSLIQRWRSRRHRPQ